VFLEASKIFGITGSMLFTRARHSCGVSLLSAGAGAEDAVCPIDVEQAATEIPHATRNDNAIFTTFTTSLVALV
jgi:hypothetical protein